MSTLPNETTVAELRHFIGRLVEAREERDYHRKLSAQCDAEVDELELKLMNMLEASNLPRFDTDEVTILRSSRTTAKVPKLPADRDAFFGYLRERGLFEDMATIHSNTLNSWLKEEAKIAEQAGVIELVVPGLTVEVRQILSVKKRT